MRYFFQFVTQQLVSVFVLPMLLALMIVPLGIPTIRETASSGIANDSLFILWLVGGALAGYGLPRVQSLGRQVARWTWILPSVLFVGVFAWEWADFGRPATLAAFFNPSEAAGGQGGEGLAALLATTPTVSAIVYSVGAAIGHARHTRHKRGKG